MKSIELFASAGGGWQARRPVRVLNMKRSLNGSMTPATRCDGTPGLKQCQLNCDLKGMNERSECEPIDENDWILSRLASLCNRGS